MATLQWFFVAMVHHPEAQRKAQAELDAIAPVRVPNFADRGRLPYVDAIYQEVMRWKSIIQLGFPHAVLEDDVYQGFRIPKGAIIISHTG